MRTRSLLWTAVMALAVPSLFATGCGDDTVAGGNGGGEEGGGGNGTGGEGNNNPTGGSGGDGGSGGSGGAPANDTCASPGDIGIAPGEEVTIQGTLVGATNDYETFCADNTPGEAAVDVVYELAVSDACTATFTLEGGAGFDGVISVRDACDTESQAGGDVCFNSTTSGVETGSVSLQMGTYYVLVSSVTAGDAFTLGVKCVSPSCGDFILDENEECDFGSTPQNGAVDGDGCDNDCNLEPVDPEVTNCVEVTSNPGQDINPGPVVNIPGSTINGLSTYNGSCQAEPTGMDSYSKENIIKVRPTAVGTMTITLGQDDMGDPSCGAAVPPFPYPNGCFDRTLYVRTACADDETEVACSESFEFQAVETVTINVAQANTDYYVFVDGWLDYFADGDQSDIGTYNLRVQLTP
jgi:cysteine-rich repeat protein